MYHKLLNLWNKEENMTNRENFLSLLRRTGYEHVPVEFVLCPHLQQVCKEQLGAENYEE